MASQNSSEKEAPAIRAPLRERGKARVAALLAAGEAVFAEKGYDAATMTEVAAKAGASIGSLYQFFPTKPLLAEAVHAELLGGLVARLDGVKADVAGLDAASTIERVFTVLGEFLADHPAFAALADRRDFDKQRKKETRALLRGRVAGLLVTATPPVPKERAVGAAVIIFHLIRATLLLNDPDEAAVREPALAEMKRMLAAYFA